jgi:hypothetical protein
MIDDWGWAAVEVFDQGFCGVDTEVVIDGCQEVARAADPLKRVFAAFVGRADDSAGFDSSTSPDV